VITFKNKKSDSLGIVFNELPNIPTGKKRTQFFTVPGRDGKLTVEDDSLEPFQLAFEGHAECTRDELLDYFSGQGQLIFDELPDRYYNVSIVEGVTIAYPLGDKRLIKFLVPIEFEPYAMRINNPLVVAGTTLTINNIYGTKAFPYFKITGNGTFTILKNSKQILEIKNVSGYVEIDSELDAIFKDNTSFERNSVGKVPVLDVGANTLVFRGNITKVEIKYNWRYR